MGFDSLTVSHVLNGGAVWTGPIPEDGKPLDALHGLVVGGAPRIDVVSSDLNSIRQLVLYSALYPEICSPNGVWSHKSLRVRNILMLVSS